MSVALPIEAGTRGPVTFVAAAGQKIFAGNFPVLASSDVLVETSIDGGVTFVARTLGTDYAVTGIGHPSGFTVTFAASRPTGSRVRLSGRQVIRNTTDFSPANALKKAGLNAKLDLLTMALQELRRDVDLANAGIPVPGPVGPPGTDGTSLLSRAHVVSAGATATFQAGDVIDEVTLVAGRTVLRVSPISPELNGPYLVPASGAAPRHPSWPTYDDLPGVEFNVLVGASFGATKWRCIAMPGGSFGVDPIDFAQPPDLTALWQPGDDDFQMRAGERPGWVRHNGRSIGPPGSGATERENEDCWPCYQVLWERHDDTICPVAGGRGLSAEADWEDGKALATIDARGAGSRGLDNMGASSAGRLTGVPFTTGSATTAGATGGENFHQLAEAKLPSLTKNLTIASAGAHRHFTVRNANSGVGLGPTVALRRQLTGGDAAAYNLQGNSGDADEGLSSEGGAHVHTGTVSFGSGETHLNVPRDILGTWYVKL